MGRKGTLRESVEEVVKTKGEARREKKAGEDRGVRIKEWAGGGAREPKSWGGFGGGV